ncbi:Zinc finger BED domain-containing protein 1 [Cyphomyrmex costatus]|uniref:Zinc finger BED domain-containing protein 1 n=1 Tax=Cyphomyrmex costatus TaxID=456900 RepID=A0A151I7T7_9HYME|nr:Zinc finger BED domain-containing protein 1 [Cyphomyrmex costatus]
MTAHLIDDNWKPKSYSLSTQQMIDRHTAANLSDAMGIIFRKWDISDKVLAVVTDNAANAVNAVRDTIEIQEQYDLTCAGHTLQLVVNKALAFPEIQEICEKAGKLVGHFRHSNVATKALQSKQEQLNMKPLKLIQSQPQLRFDLDYLEWWKARADRFPILSNLARKYLCIPASSANSERTFSTAGNIVTSKRSCLSPENVSMLVFLYQNKSIIESDIILSK